MGLAECKGSRLSRLEAAYADAEWSEVEGLAKALGVTAHWLAGLEEVPAPVAVPAATVLFEPTAPPVPAAPVATPAAVIVPVPETGPHPDLAALERSAHRSDYDFRQHLAAALARARAKLHEAGLPAADWKHWRLVERTAVDQLRRCT